jgi:hypothetical protein
MGQTFKEQLHAEAKARRARMSRAAIAALPVVRMPVRHCVITPPTLPAQEKRHPNSMANLKHPPTPAFDSQHHLPTSKESFEHIGQVVAAHMRVPYDQIKSKSRTQQVALARHLLLYVAYQVLPASRIERIAKWLGSDPSSITYGVRRIHNSMNRHRGDVGAIMTLLGVTHGPDRLAETQ